MAKGPEHKVKQAVIKILKAAGASYFMPSMSGYGRAGISDIIVCYRGRFIACECKATSTKKPTALQSAYLREVREAGGHALVIHKDNVDAVYTLVKLIGDS